MRGLAITAYYIAAAGLALSMVSRHAHHQKYCGLVTASNRIGYEEAQATVIIEQP
jgi:hypothetical protein